MDMRFEATPMTATSEMAAAVIKAVKRLFRKVIALVEQVASISCPALTSIERNAPNTFYTIGEVAWA